MENMVSERTLPHPIPTRFGEWFEYEGFTDWQEFEMIFIANYHDARNKGCRLIDLLVGEEEWLILRRQPSRRPDLVAPNGDSMMMWDVPVYRIATVAHAFIIRLARG